MSSWSNWAGNVAAHPRQVIAPVSVDEIRAAVRDADRRGESVRVAGAGHSFAPLCATDGLLLDLAGLSGIDQVDPGSGDATIWAGTRIHEIGEPLLAAGRALPNQGDIDRQAIAGAVATGTHGTGRRFGSFSNAVRAIELVTAEGDLVLIDATSPEEERRAAALNLGLLGVVTRIRLATVPAYKLHERTQPLTFEECLAAFQHAERSERHAEFWWIPPLDVAVLKTLSETNEEPFGEPEQEHPPGTIQRYLKPERVDWSCRVFASSRSFKFVESEYTIPIEQGPDAMRAIRNLMQTRHRDIRWVVEYRTVPGESHLLSPTQGADSVTISVHQAATDPHEPFMRDTEEIFLAHGGRPHWGKLHWLDRTSLDRLYPEIETLRQVRRVFDRTGRFLNEHLKPVFE